MRCPGCEFVSSDLRDICPRCYIDLRPHKKILGLKVTNSKASYDELLSKQLPPGTKSRKAKSKQDAKPKPQKSVAPVASAPSSIPTPTPTPTPTQPSPKPAPQLPPTKQRGPSFASTVFTKLKSVLQRPAPSLPSETLSKDVSPASIEPTKPDTLEPVVAITQPEIRVQTSVEAKVEPEIDPSLAKFYNEPLLPPTPPPAPPVLDLSETQEDFSSLLDSIIDQSEVTIESIEGKADTAQKSTSAADDDHADFEFEFPEEELEKPKEEDVIEPSKVASPETAPEPIEEPAPEPLISLPLLPSSSPPTVLPEAREDLQSHIEPINEQNGHGELLEERHYAQPYTPEVELPQEKEKVAEQEVEQAAAFEVEPAIEPVEQPVETYLQVAEVFEPLYPESKPLRFQSRAPEYAFSEIAITENVVPPATALLETNHPALEQVAPECTEPEQPEPSLEPKEELNDKLSEQLDDVEVAFEFELQDDIAKDVYAQKEAAPPPEVLVASLCEHQANGQPEVVGEAQLENQQQTDGHGFDQFTQPPLIDDEPSPPAHAALSSSIAFDLSSQQITETNQMFDLLQAQPWQENQAIVLSADSLGLTTDRETLELLFDLSLESLTNPEVEHILEKDIARSESRHLTNESLEKQLKRVEQELSKSVVSLKGVAGSRSNIPDQPTSKEFDFSQVGPTLRQRAISILCDLALVVSVSAVFSIVRTISTEIALPSTESVYDFAIDAAPIFSSFIVMCLALLPIYTIAAFFTLGNTVGGIVGKIDIRTSTGKIPKPANLILRGLALPISLFLPAMRLQDRISRTLACRGGAEE